MARPRSPLRVGRGPRRETNWVQSADQGYVAIAAGSSVLTQSFQGVNQQVNTVVRTRGILSITVASAVADIELVGALGFGIVSAQALAAGAGSIPGPYADAGWDGWFLHQFFSSRFESVDQTGVLILSWEHLLDSKAMRKLRDDDAIVVMVESQSAAMRASVQFRLLFKLS